MGKKALSAEPSDESVWEREAAIDFENEGVEDGLRTEAALLAQQNKPLRQRIEEYFERKRLAEALQEDLDDDILRA